MSNLSGLSKKRLKVYEKNQKYKKRCFIRWEAFYRSPCSLILRNAYKEHLERYYGLEELPYLWHTDREHLPLLFYDFLISTDCGTITHKYELDRGCHIWGFHVGWDLARRTNGLGITKAALSTEPGGNRTQLFIDESMDMEQIIAELAVHREAHYGKRKPKSQEDGIELLDFWLWDAHKARKSYWEIASKIYKMENLTPQKCGFTECDVFEGCGIPELCRVAARFKKDVRDRIKRVNTLISSFTPPA